MGLTHSSAGVYINERDFSQRPARSISTVAAVLGEALRGPVGQATLVTSESDYIATFGKPEASLSWLGYSAVAYLTEGTQLYVTRVAPTALYGGCIIGWDGLFNTHRPFGVGEADPTLVAMLPSDLFAVYAINPGAWNEELFVRVLPNTKLFAGHFYVEVYKRNVALPVERFAVHLGYKVDGFGVQLNLEAVINRKSKYIRVLQNHEQANLVANENMQLVNTFDAGGSTTALGIQLVGGADGRRATVADFMQALDVYRDPEAIDINMFIQSGIEDSPPTGDFARELDAVCRDRMDCVAILDVPSDMQSVQDAISYRRDVLHMDTSYAALYSSDLLVADKFNDIRLYTPVSGYVAACYARTDRDFESWFAPAGMVRGDLSVSGIREVYDQGKRDALYDSQVNAIRTIEGAGIKVWGADTLQVMPSALSNMSVRRLMIVIEKTIANTLLYSVFDPNDAHLRSRIELACRRFLKQIKDARGLYEYEAICDDSNNTSDIIAAGDMVVDLWCDPVLPAKRIMFTAIINRTGVRVTGA